MNLLPDFSWAVPEAFLDTLSQCRFTEGECLYDSPAAYRLPWGEAVKEMHLSVQVIYPRAAVITQEERTLRFSGNWGEHVEFKLTNHQTGKTELIKTTHGNLYTLIWKGKLEEEPQPLPKPLAEINKNHLHVEKLPVTRPGWCFAFAYDIANPVSREKKTNLESSLNCSVDEYRASEVPFWESLDILPTTRLVLLHFASEDEPEIHAQLKKLLYKPNPKAKRTAFILRAHGVLLNLSPQQQLVF